MPFRNLLNKFFELSEDFIYIVIAFILLITSLFLTYDATHTILHFNSEISIFRWAVELIDKTLLLLMIIEILYTLKVSFQSHSLCAEPFLVVALIAAIRRILIISVETAYLPEKFNFHMIEISILGVLIMIFVLSLILMKKYSVFQIPSQKTKE